jgi:hypothetical protein
MCYLGVSDLFSTKNAYDFDLQMWILNILCNSLSDLQKGLRFSRVPWFSPQNVIAEIFIKTPIFLWCFFDKVIG